MFRTAILFFLLISSHSMVIGQENPPEETPEVPIDPPFPQLQVNQRTLGDQYFGISAGLYIPLFTVLINDWPNSKYTAGSWPTNLNPGGSGYLGYGFYLSPNWKLGLHIGFNFAQDINKNFAWTFPITFKGSYEFHPTGRISIPIFLETGIAMTSWKEDNFLVDWIVIPGTGFYFDWSYDWSFGLDIFYLFIPQSGMEFEYEKSIGNFLNITLTAEYHF